jgi:hypothetical protein
MPGGTIVVAAGGLVLEGVGAVVPGEVMPGASVVAVVLEVAGRRFGNGASDMTLWVCLLEPKWLRTGRWPRSTAGLCNRAPAARPTVMLDYPRDHS